MSPTPDNQLKTLRLIGAGFAFLAVLGLVALVLWILINYPRF